MSNQRASPFKDALSKLRWSMNKSLSRLCGKVLKASRNVSEETHRIANNVETSKNFVKLSDNITLVPTYNLLSESLRCIDAVSYTHLTLPTICSV